MNKQRRKQIDQILEKLAELSAMVEEVYNDEDEAYNNLPESIQDSERGEAMYEAVDALESAYSACEELQEYLEPAQMQ